MGDSFENPHIYIYIYIYILRTRSTIHRKWIETHTKIYVSNHVNKMRQILLNVWIIQWKFLVFIYSHEHLAPCPNTNADFFVTAPTGTILSYIWINFNISSQTDIAWSGGHFVQISSCWPPQDARYYILMFRLCFFRTWVADHDRV